MSILTGLCPPLDSNQGQHSTQINLCCYNNQGHLCYFCAHFLYRNSDDTSTSESLFDFIATMSSLLVELKAVGDFSQNRANDSNKQNEPFFRFYACVPT